MDKGEQLYQMALQHLEAGKLDLYRATLLMAAKADNDAALGLVGKDEMLGNGFEYNPEEGFKKLEKSYAILDNTAVLADIAYARFRGIGTKYDPAKAVEDAEHAFKVSSGKSGGYVLGLAYWEGRGVKRDQIKALNIWKQGSELGDIGAFGMLNVEYALANEGVNKVLGTQIKPVEAAKALQGKSFLYFPYIYGKMSLMCEKGVGFSFDPGTVIYIARMGEEGHDPYSLYRVGLCYEKGYGVSLDLTKALSYYTKAMNLHCVDAYLKLAEIYGTDRYGLKPNRSLALGALEKAKTVASYSDLKVIEEVASKL